MSLKYLAFSSTWLRLLLAGASIFIIALLTVFNAYAQDPSGVIRIRQMDIANYPAISAILEVSDSRGLPIQNLTSPDLTVFEDGSQVNAVMLTSTIDANIPVGVVLALDISGSMGGPPLERAKESAKTFLDQLSPADQVAIVSFSSEVKVVQGFTTDKAQAKAVLDSLLAEGDTKLFDAFYNTVEIAQNSGLRHSLVVLLTDGEDTQSSRTIEDGIRLALEGGTPVFTIGLGQVDRDQLDRISEETDGASLYAPSEDDLARAYQSVSEWLRSFYLLTFISPQQAGPPQRVLEAKAQHESEELVGSITFELDLPPINAKLKNLEAGEDLEQERVLQVEIDRPEWVTEVAVTVDGQILASLSKAPFEVMLAPNNLDAGVHVVEVKIKDIIQREASLERTFRIPAPLASPPPPMLTESTPFWRVMLRWLYNNRLLPLGIAAIVLSTIGLVRQIILRRRGVKCPSCQRRYRRQGACPHCSTHPKAQPRRLGQILLKSGLITTEQLDTTLAQQDNVKKMINDLIFEENLSEDQQERMRKWLGEIIVEQNLIDKNDLRTALQLQAKHNAFASRLHRLFRERELAQLGRASFMLYMLFYGAGGVAGGVFLYLYYLSTV